MKNLWLLCLIMSVMLSLLYVVYPVSSKSSKSFKSRSLQTPETPKTPDVNKEILLNIPGKDGKDGLSGEDGKDGKDGKDGEPGKNGKDGEPGKDGKDGKDGLPGKDGKDGLPGKDGKDGLPGKDGKDGLPGKDGKDGLPGKDGKDAVVEAVEFNVGKWRLGNTTEYPAVLGNKVFIQQVGKEISISVTSLSTTLGVRPKSSATYIVSEIPIPEKFRPKKNNSAYVLFVEQAKRSVCYAYVTSTGMIRIERLNKKMAFGGTTGPIQFDSFILKYQV